MYHLPYSVNHNFTIFNMAASENLENRLHVRHVIRQKRGPRFRAFSATQGWFEGTRTPAHHTGRRTNFAT